MVVAAEENLLRDTQLEYFEAMKEAGKEVKLVFEHVMGHCYYLNKIAIDCDPKTAARVDYLIGEITKFMNGH